MHSTHHVDLTHAASPQVKRRNIEDLNATIKASVLIHALPYPKPKSPAYSPSLSKSLSLSLSLIQELRDTVEKLHVERANLKDEILDLKQAP